MAPFVFLVSINDSSFGGFGWVAPCLVDSGVLDFCDAVPAGGSVESDEAFLLSGEGTTLNLGDALDECVGGDGGEFREGDEDVDSAMMPADLLADVP